MSGYARLVGHVVRWANAANPLPRGQAWTAKMGHRIGAELPPGIYRIARGVRMELDTRDSLERAIAFLIYEVRTTRRVMTRVRPGMVICDAGANIGYYTLQFRARVGSGGRVLAFEPHPHTRERLQRNLALNGYADVAVLPYAVGDHNREVELSTPVGRTHGESTLGTVDGEGVERHSVGMRTLESVWPEAVSRLDLIKVDVEGAEELVLEGAQELLRRHRPDLVMEVNTCAAEALGRDPYGAVRLALRCVPEYRIRVIDTPQVQAVQADDLDRVPGSSHNILLTAGR